MPGDEGGGVEQKRGEEGSESISDTGLDREGKRGCSGVRSQGRREEAAVPPPKISIVISQPEEVPNHLKISKSAAAESDEKIDGVAAAKKGCLPRSESYQEQCRVCQQQTEEPLMSLGCGCRGELAQAHRSCIELWFRTRGSNKCEICQQMAVNIPIPESQPSTNYWVWRVDSASGGGQGQQERRFFSPLSVAFAILIGGLLLDVLISISLGVSALPVNIIIGILIVLGLGTAFRLALECCYEWGSRRNIQMADMTTNMVMNEEASGHEDKTCYPRSTYGSRLAGQPARLN